ncbi:tRNA glutamyl-Q(34) synthetase GluQRS [Ferrimonas lipolytica]|uniref:Glutamyl-Q tRNA(Asp) synthetase n=1 Tax=Ferrimonas lipolytica TaxID=2724191 RepID=A0A6H1UIR0_9GAMM|nr:tRNA glutamyl-Q(34) synthetase GluQRS [Ferrimonas lipolytica]QIZ77682.1 tRNA glutamyl-Q(34) synthetase GluQRS [Ferrimonas lipolytica]
MPAYVGRFAPSPSGPLHFGSLLAAVGSYLRARNLGGQWLVRMEDIDPPREVPGAATTILHQLEQYGLHWDGSVRYQSQQNERYEAILAQLYEQRLSYHCDCPRKRIKAVGGIYDRHCRNLAKPAEDCAVRLVNQHGCHQFNDLLLGQIETDSAFASEDFILKRRDGLYAYQLAVVVDDHDQGITEIVRGNDLLEPTVRQISLYHTLNWQTPSFLHLPLAINVDGNKLSKQNHAPALDSTNVSHTMATALDLLGQPLPAELNKAPVAEQLNYAVAAFELTRVPTTRQLAAPCR